MSDTATALRALLVADGMVGARIAPWQEIRGADRPYIAYEQIDGEHLHSLTGGSALAHFSYQYGCVAETYEGACALTTAVREVLGGYRGTSEGVVIQSCLVTGERDAPVAPTAGREKPIYTRQIDVSVWATESVP